MASPTPNKGMTYPPHGGAVNAWDSPLNQNFDQLDQNLGGFYAITLGTSIAAVTYGSTGTTAPSSVAALTLPSSIAQNVNYSLTGTLTQNLTLSFPAVGSFYELANNSSGSFTFTVNTVAVGSSGAVVAQGNRMFAFSDGTNMTQADTSAVAKLYSYLGNPNGNVAGNAATSNGALTDVVWDATNGQLYACTLTGGSTSAIFTVAAPSLPTPQMYLTPTTGVPVIASDVTSNTVFLTALQGGWMTLASSGGTLLYATQITTDLSLSISAVLGGNIYDVFLTTLSSVGTFLGYGPSWTAGTTPGSVTPGACARGSGANSTALSRTRGVLTNTVSMTLTNGSTNFNNIAVGAAVYVGSIAPLSNGTVTCHRSYGQNRRWDISNPLNPVPVMLKGGDPSVGPWVYGNPAWRPSHGSSANTITTFCGLAQEEISLSLDQLLNPVSGTGQVGIGVNSSNVTSGMIAGTPSWSNVGAFTAHASYIAAPTLGLNAFTALESGNNFYGTELNQVLAAKWRA